MTSVDITLFLPSLEGGGTRRIFTNLANYFYSDNFNTEIVLVNKRGEYLDQLIDGIKVRKFNASRMLTCLPELVKYIQQYEPDVLLSTMFDCNIMALLAKKLAVGADTKVAIRVPIVLSRNLKSSALQERYKIIPQLITNLYPLADSIIAISEGVAEDLAVNFGVNRDQIRVIYNPIINKSIIEQSRESLTHPWFHENSDIVIGVGRLTEQKDFSTLLRSFSMVHEKADAKLIILGSGELKEELESLANQLQISNSVDFLGHVENPYKYMADSDVFVLSSAWEGFGNVLVEAMACKTPTVSTDCPSGPSEILSYGEYGPLVPVGDEKKLAGSILHQLESPTNSESLFKRANDFTVQKRGREYKEEILLKRNNL